MNITIIMGGNKKRIIRKKSLDNLIKVMLRNNKYKMIENK